MLVYCGTDVYYGADAHADDASVLCDVCTYDDLDGVDAYGDGPYGAGSTP